MAVTEESLTQFIKKLRQIDVEPETTLFSDGTIDSLGMVEIITFIEEKADFQVGQEEVTLENFDTVSRMVAFAQSRAAED